eukprot:Plantae.Rhodophyta-Hildenbrandia_rubra.ctg6421.p1 GENE.Plantae.Rhodophyta-Hildenbrandia_rubra.ctg6421~~Plantae.Rhodophyta-Hildenbrandia_rubra.ctg6421.p1  ORF type:complete len:476 (+),score=74.28 Plantae.Rhodophyta-Hildenbrandia_rubra.ctg6421:235-1662(+)
MPTLASRCLHFCVVGSGPSGFYSLSTLLKRFPSCRVDLLERLPVPFGLLRYGIAPDHPEARAVANSFGNLMKENPRVRFFGNVKVGEDGGVDIATLQRRYSGVILAVGCSKDKKIGIPGETLADVKGAGEFVKWYNGHPEYEGRKFGLDEVERVVVVGNGNVALDVGRILLRNPDSLRTSDMPEYALEELRKSSVRSVNIIGRRGLAQAAWTAKELRECLSGLDGTFDIDAITSEIELDPEDVSELKTQRSKRRCADLVKKHFSTKSAETINGVGRKGKSLSLRFLLSPMEFIASSGKRLEKVRLIRNELVGEPGARKAVPVIPKESENISCQLALRSIGYRGIGLAGVLYDDWKGRYVNDRGRIKRGLYCTGWCKRGPQGIVGSNLWDAEETVESIAKDVDCGHLDGSKSFSSPVFGEYVDWNGWMRLDQVERERGAQRGKEREKVIRIGEMIDIMNTAGPRAAVSGHECVGGN